MLFCPDQQHHGPLHFFRHLVAPGFRRHGFLNGFDGEAAFEQAIQNLRQSVMVLLHLVPKEIRSPLFGVVVIRHGPGAVGGELLVDARREGGMLDVEKEDSARFQRPMDEAVDFLQVLDVMQNQVGHHQIVAFCGVVVVMDAADAVFDVFCHISALGFPDHQFALVDAQDKSRAVIGGILAVPTIAAAQVQNGFVMQVWEQRLQLGPLARTCEAQLAPGHFGIFREKIGVVILVHKNTILCDDYTTKPEIYKSFMHFSAVVVY